MSSKTSEIKQCADCKFWKQNDINEDAQYGECRKRAPKLIIAGCGVGENPERRLDWAETKYDDWCGEFKTKIVNRK